MGVGEVHGLALRKARAYVKIGRPSDALRPMLLFLLGASIAGGGLSISWQAGAVLLSLLFLSMGVVAYNDVADLSIDRISNPARPLPSGVMGVREAQMLAAVYGALALALAIAAGTVALLAWLLLAMLGYAYSRWRLSHSLIASPAILLSCDIIIPLLLGESFTTGALPQNATVLALCALLAALGMSIGGYKDLKDVAGDREAGKRTLFTMARARVVVLWCTLSSAAVLAAISAWWLRGGGGVLVPIICAALLLTQLVILLAPRIAVPALWTEVNLLVVAMLVRFA